MIGHVRTVKYQAVYVMEKRGRRVTKQRVNCSWSKGKKGH